MYPNLLVQSLGEKLNNDYSNVNAVKKGIIFDKNKDGSYFTLRPYLPTNLFQITKNDTTGLMNLDSSGNVKISGSVSAKDFTTDKGISLTDLSNSIFVAQTYVSFTNGIGKYSNSKISSSYICLFNRNNSVVSTGTTTPQSSSCGNGYVDLVLESKVTETYLINMIFIKKNFGQQ